MNDTRIVDELADRPDGPKKRVHKEQIQPLIRQICEICTANQIPWLAYFSLDLIPEAMNPSTSTRR